MARAENLRDMIVERDVTWICRTLQKREERAREMEGRLRALENGRWGRRRRGEDDRAGMRRHPMPERVFAICREIITPHHSLSGDPSFP